MVSNGFIVTGAVVLYSGVTYLFSDPSGSKQQSAALKLLEKQLDRCGPESLHVAAPPATECSWFQVGHAFFTGLLFTLCFVTPFSVWVWARFSRSRREPDLQDRSEVVPRLDSPVHSPSQGRQRATIALEYRELQALGW